MINFEDQKNKKEVISSPEELSENSEKDQELSKNELREKGENESRKVLNNINAAVESAMNSIGDNPEMKDEIDKLASEAKNEIINSTEEFENKLENEGFGKAFITNPKILDLIAEIEYCHVEDAEMKEQMINGWKKMVNGQYNDAVKSYDRRRDKSVEIIYGSGGYHRFIVSGGEVQLVNKPESNLKVTASALKRAQELGMKIKES